MLIQLDQPALATLRDDVAKLLEAYANSGVLTGRGSVELKRIKKKKVTVVLDENGQPMVKEITTVEMGPYAYIRQWVINDKGRLTNATTGYYGKGGAAAVGDGHEAKLLEAHLNGGQDAGDYFLFSLGYDTPERLRLENQPIANRPVHPLGDETITSASLRASPIFRHYQAHAPVHADELITAVITFESDLLAFNYAQERNLQYRQSNERLARKRKRARRKDGTAPRFQRRAS